MQDIYALDITHDVYDFLITKRGDADQLLNMQGRQRPREQLLIAADATGLRISLYLDQQVIENLQANNPLEQLDRDNLQDCCLAMEGVSHFLYVIWNASYDRAVTRLELELQAEVDKFISILALQSRQQATGFGEVIELLFEQVRYIEDLSVEERQRYETANHLATRYCTQLQQHFIRRGRVAEMLGELRRFYRMTEGHKRRRITLSSSHQKNPHCSWLL